MKLIEALKIVRTPQDQMKPRFVTSLVCGFNPLHFQTFLDAELRSQTVQCRPEINIGLYGDFWGNLERVQATDSDAIAIVLEWPDLDPRLGMRSLGSWTPSVLPDVIESAERKCQHLELAIQAFASKSLVACCFPTLPLPPVAFTPGWRASTLEAELKAILARLSARLVKTDNVRVLSQQRLDELSPLGERLDVRSELISGFPYQLKHASVLAELLSRLCAEVPSKKGLITDLDNTLWHGILGEVGADGVSWDLDHHSQIHGVYQRFLHSLSAAGILIGVASKNEPSRVAEVFQRKDMILPRESVFPMEIHWGAKSGSVARIMEAWNIGPEGIVFVDDSPNELAEVRCFHPGVECISFPTEEPHRMVPLLQTLRDLFGKSVITEEDALRAQSVRQSHHNQVIDRGVAGAPDAFLREAEAQLDLNFSKGPFDSRAFELINKTNQFNLNGRRFTTAEWNRYIADPGTFLLLVTYADKYGSLGKIAVITGRPMGSTLIVDNWVMSCRAFGRRIEHACLEVLYEKFDASQIDFAFSSTERNGPMQAFLGEMFGKPPLSRCGLSRETFRDRGPKTFHLVEEVGRG